MKIEEMSPEQLVLEANRQGVKFVSPLPESSSRNWWSAIADRFARILKGNA